MSIYIRCHDHRGVIHSVEKFQSLWDGKKFNLSNLHNQCLVSLIKYFTSEQIDYIFLNFGHLILNDLDLVFDRFIRTEPRNLANKLYDGGLKIHGLKEHLEKNLIELVAEEMSYCNGRDAYGTFAELLLHIKIYIEPERINYIKSDYVVISLLNDNPFYKFKERIKIIQTKNKKFIKYGLQLIIVSELKHRYQKRKIIRAKKFMVSKLGIIKDLAALILQF
jgi:hypothetical protein